MDEKRLWAAVLIQAIKDLVGFTLVENKRDRARLQYFARLWFNSNNYELGSYLWICDELGLSPSSLRRRMIMSLKSDQVGKKAGSFSAARLQGVLVGADEYTLQCANDVLSA